MPNNPGRIKALIFDAYGTLFDVYAVTALCEEFFPGHGAGLASLWRAKQLQYSLLRSMMNRYRDFWQVTEDSLVYSARSLKLELTDNARARLMDAYLTLAAFPDVKAGLEQLGSMGLRLSILSNGEPRMLAAAARHAGIAHLLDAVISVDDIRIFKPHPHVYALAETRLGISRTDAAFVSANNWDVQGAGAAGLTALWLQRAGADPSEELGFPAAHVVRTMAELCTFVDQRHHLPG